MFIKPLTGPQAGARKYDLLTALSLLGLHGPRQMRISLLRLLSVVTARYNWKANELSIGQAEMARIWGVTERTAKREVRTWIAERLVIRSRAPSRGRVGAYRLDLSEIWHRSAQFWPLIGPDFTERMLAEHPVTAAENLQTPTPIPEEKTTSPWGAVRDRLRRHDPAIYQHWIAPLDYVSDTGCCVTLRAPSRFMAHYVKTRLGPVLDAAIEAEIGPMRRVEIVGDSRAVEAD
ncbi:DnaA-like protein [Palleronia aestuarii]|uniref:DnaA-like protein n=1 Tax=Palleronia aestuarii TaxID=568105 RepID=A0A2W7NJZ6_9RHOB|nr:DnaA N-terminal domain-containing protein [Palleronia aestuarii]PZX17024.1 DnaA-like protein [Palleronia aestuarii]